MSGEVRGTLRTGSRFYWSRWMCKDLLVGVERRRPGSDSPDVEDRKGKVATHRIS